MTQAYANAPYGVVVLLYSAQWVDTVYVNERMGEMFVWRPQSWRRWCGSPRCILYAAVAYRRLCRYVPCQNHGAVCWAADVLYARALLSQVWYATLLLQLKVLRILFRVFVCSLL